LDILPPKLLLNKRNDSRIYGSKTRIASYNIIIYEKTGKFEFPCFTKQTGSFSVSGYSSTVRWRVRDQGRFLSVLPTHHHHLRSEIKILRKTSGLCAYAGRIFTFFRVQPGGFTSRQNTDKGREELNCFQSWTESL